MWPGIPEEAFWDGTQLPPQDLVQQGINVHRIGPFDERNAHHQFWNGSYAMLSDPRLRPPPENVGLSSGVTSIFDPMRRPFLPGYP